MELINKDSLLKEVPLFADLSEEERSFIREKVSLVEYKKGQTIYIEGSPPDAFYCLVLGRVLIYTQGPDGSRKVLEYLHRGKYFGIISLLTGETHSVTAQAINDSALLVVKKDNFDSILKKIPRLAIDLSQSLSRRLKRKDIHQKTIFESTIISVFSSYSPAGKSVYTINLAFSLKKETRKSVLVLEICPKDKAHSIPEKIGRERNQPIFDLSSYVLADAAKAIYDFIVQEANGIDLICAWYQPEDASSMKRLVGILSRLVNDYHYIILDLPSKMEQIILEILNQSDLIHILTSPEEIDLKRTANLIERLRGDFNFRPDKIKVIINEYKLSKLTYEEQLGLLNHSIFATLPRIELVGSDKPVLEETESEYAKAIRRVSRYLGDCRVGLALGVGVAYGFCHIGVLKVIEEEKIPIDAISGASVGALIASLWVTGKSSSQILEIAREFREPKYLWNMMDFTIPWLGFIKGDKLYKFVKKHLGNQTFHDVRLPLKIIASDMKKKEPIIFDKGLLVDAIMASCTMPGVFRPFRMKEDVLFDGGVVMPLPTEILFQMGINKIIAVNVTPSREDALREYERNKEVAVSIFERKVKFNLFNLKEYFRAKLKTNILDIIFSSFEIMQSEVAHKEAQWADIVLHPDTSGLHWLELHRAGDFAKRGEDEVRRNLDKIRQVINE